ncbi:MAG: penicillin-binding protein [Clostridia bacterium]|nr:penicillin-binding protein [Clostridia bacterium]
MAKIEKRAFLCLIVSLAFVLGILFYIGELVVDGDDWATFYANQHIYHNGQLNVGAIYDRDGNLLVENTKKGPVYNEDYENRVANVHAVGDCYGNVATGAQYAFRSDLVGYNFLTGTYSISSSGRSIYLSIDSEANKEAKRALGYSDGLVGVYNYKTGEILCMVSSPGYDPKNPPSPDQAASGTYINKFMSSTITPGSIFKLVTTEAALEQKVDYDSWTYTCTGKTEINGEIVHCTAAHGYQDKDAALANSCNCAYAHLAVDLGGKTLRKYVKKAGLDSSYDVDGIQTAKGSFNFPSESNINLSWAGIGQFEDQVNPLSYMVFMGAIANGGEAAMPYLVKDIKVENAFSIHKGKAVMTDELINSNTASLLAKMMKNNVKKTYGEYNYPGLDIYAKSGTAERGDGYANTWFTGFLKDEEHPYAFIVCVEKGATGAGTAGPIANRVLQSLVSK